MKRFQFWYVGADEDSGIIVIFNGENKVIPGTEGIEESSLQSIAIIHNSCFLED